MTRRRALDLLVARLLPGREQEVRADMPRDLVLRLSLAEASLTVRAAGAGDKPTEGVWAGVIPLVTRTLAPGAESSSELPACVARFVSAMDGAEPAYR